MRVNLHIENSKVIVALGECNSEGVDVGERVSDGGPAERELNAVLADLAGNQREGVDVHGATQQAGAEGEE